MEEVPKYDNYYELFKSVLANGCSISFESAWGDGPSFSWSGEMPSYVADVLGDYDFASEFLCDISATIYNPCSDDEYDAEWGSLYLKDEEIYYSVTRRFESSSGYERIKFSDTQMSKILNNFQFIYNKPESLKRFDLEPLTSKNLSEIEFFYDEPIEFENDGKGNFKYSGYRDTPEMLFYVNDDERFLTGKGVDDFFQFTLQFMAKLSEYNYVQEIYFYGDGYKVIGAVDADISTTLKSWKYIQS